ncbi:hypothetical protein [Nocardia sp. NPDC049707]|uniref:hypothetical protein n=1 Tax=Nocardia sp. NPDC049707 TaxID=3154735 RepID=UPI003435FC42
MPWRQLGLVIVVVVVFASTIVWAGWVVCKSPSGDGLDGHRNTTRDGTGYADFGVSAAGILSRLEDEYDANSDADSGGEG